VPSRSGIALTVFERAILEDSLDLLESMQSEMTGAVCRTRAIILSRNDASATQTSGAQNRVASLALIRIAQTIVETDSVIAV
jgi:hypothetical protein